MNSVKPEIIETTYKVEFEFDDYKNLELLVESFMTISAIFSKCVKCSFSISFPDIIENNGWTRNIEIDFKSSRPLLYDEYKSLSKTLCKISWSCIIKDQETYINTMIRKEHVNNEQELSLGDYSWL